MTAIIFDTETTGVIEAQIIEAAGVLVHLDAGGLNVGSDWIQRYKPSKPIGFSAMATHHILPSDLERCPPHTDFALPAGVTYIIGHKIDFDWEVAGQPDVKRICTLALARSIWPGADSHSLSAMAYMTSSNLEATREQLRGAHNALTDVLLCADLLRKILAVMPAESMENLWQASELARVPKVMPFGKHKDEPIASIPRDYKAWLLRQPNIDPYLVRALRA